MRSKLPDMLATLACAVLQSPAGFDPGPSPMLMRHPTLSADKIAFQFAGEIWEVPRKGGQAVRLTASGGHDGDPVLSPDGSMIAFSGVYDGNVDVYVMPSNGGEPRRLTSHPAPDVPVAWTPDGTSVVFTSSMLSNTDYPRLFTVLTTGGMPKPLPFPSGTDVAFSPDGARVAYVPTTKWELAWKRYRGGQTAPIWLAKLSDSRVKAIPRDNTDDHRPMWIGDSIYFLADPTGPVGMFRYDLATSQTTTVIPGQGFDIKYAAAGPGAIVFERLGSLWLYSLDSHLSARVPVTIHGDFADVRPEFKDVSRSIESVDISPTGKRLVANARGWIFTAPAKKGDTRVLDGPQGVHRRDPAWSPDGKTIAYITDQDGDQSLALYDLAAAKERRLPLGDPPAFYDRPLWSPDSKRIAYTDNRLKLWSLDVATGKSTPIDEGTYRGRTEMDPAWSPDSQWLAWSRDLPNNVKVVILHSFATGKNTPITDGLAEAWSPVFDRNGKELYFLASTDVGVGSDFEDMSSMTARESTSQVYAVVLRKNLPNPLQPESDEEGADPAKADGAKKPDGVPKVDIDLDGIERRIIALPMPRQSYRSLTAGPSATFFAVGGGRGESWVRRFSFADRKDTLFAEGFRGCTLSADGNWLLLYPGPVAIVSANAPTKGPEGGVSLSGFKVKIDPRAEWTAMYHEVWRDERLLFYDPNLHGVDSYQLERRYLPFLAGIQTRDDLNYLFTDMLGELTIGHMWARGGDLPRAASVAGGLLGADFAFENHRYRLTRIYDGERWNPDLYAPLSQPGVDAQPGEYLLAIDGKDLTEATDLYDALEGKAGLQVKLRIGPTPDGKAARVVTVVPVTSEFELRTRAWEEDNRRLVAKMTDGQGGYVHVPDTGGGGWEAFNRYYYAQSDRTGMIVDDRFNHGGYVNDWMVREMEKPFDFMSRTRHGQDIKMPMAAVFGPKVMMINEMAGSGGDIFPFLFRQDHVGPLVGKRTWGAMLSAYSFEIIDEGFVNAPDDAMYNPRTGKWIIENWGTAPDIDVDLDPYLWRQGRDSQLEAAIAELKREMADHPPLKIKRPTIRTSLRSRRSEMALDGLILTVNAGSTSLRFAFFSREEPAKRVADGKLERVDAGTTAESIFDRLAARPEFSGVAAIGHRVVHGFAHEGPALVTPDLVQELRGLVPYDPDHMPREIALIEAFQSRQPDLPQVACFDTSFHRSMPRVAKLLPLPRRFDAEGVQRYGFHGLSYAFLMEELERLGDRAAKEGRVVLAHLGGGASMAAVLAGKSIDTSMAFTPTAGLVMGTRTGDLDPGLVAFLHDRESMDAKAFQKMVNRESGLLGVSETSDDMRDLAGRQATDVRAKEAIDLFCYVAKKQIGAYAAALGGINTLVFAGGIGENSPLVRAHACAGLEFLGIGLDESANEDNAPVISRSDARVTVRIIKTDEESMIARSVARLLPQ